MNASARWSDNAITFADNITVGMWSSGIFINTENTVYVADRSNSRILIWLNNSINPTSTISGGFVLPASIFVTVSGDIYVDDGSINARVDKLTMNTNISVSVMYTGGECYDVFVDINNNLYCSLGNFHQVIRKSLDSILNTTTIVAGIGCNGSTANMLNYPQGIFVDINLDLYVADCRNNRIQLFQSEQLDAITVAGSGSLNITISLNCPTGVVLDADGYLFIVDSENNRIVGSGSDGFRCLVGCSNSTGSASNQLNGPRTLSFDSYGNMFVTDYGNNRIQKFSLLTNSYGKSIKMFTEKIEGVSSNRTNKD